MSRSLSGHIRHWYRTGKVSKKLRDREKMSDQRKEIAEEKNKEVFSDHKESIRTAASGNHGLPQQQTIFNIPEVVDDFLRNFLRRSGLSRTLNSFEAEWYSSTQKLLKETLMPQTPQTGVFFIPDALTHRHLIQSKLQEVRQETDLLRQEVLAMGESLVKMQRERDFHQLRCQKVAEDKNKLMEEIQQLRKHLESYEPALRQLDDKYQAALKQKTLICLEKDRAQHSEARLNREKPELKKERSFKRSVSSDKPSATSVTSRTSKDSKFPVCCSHLRQVTSQQWKSPTSLSLTCSIRAHKLPISYISLHPQKMILASTSDDCSWRLWALPASGETVGHMVLTGKGHSDWLSSCSFHPDGTKMATTSGDATVRLWDFSHGRCVLTLSGHSQLTWGCSFHSCGDFLASCSADRTAKLWDLNSQRCHLTLRRHTASVNSICFLPFSNLLLTSSADKTVTLWDARLGVCTTTLHGHLYSCNHAAFSPSGDIVASCDSHGVVKLWDIRKPQSATATVDVGPLCSNQVVFSPSEKMLAVACSDGLVRLVEVDSQAVSSLSGHADAVQSVTFDHRGETVMSAGSDGLINVWSEKVK